MIYPELFHTLEKSRWAMHELPWREFDPSKLSDEQALTIKMNAITEFASLPATEMFLRDNGEDADFCSFMSIWYYEEMKHALVLVEYLKRFRPELVPSAQELAAVRFAFDPAPPHETLMLHFCGELRLTQWYRRAARWHEEPLIQHIYGLLSADEARHGGAYYRYMERAVDQHGDEARLAFAKIGLLMASGKPGKAVHPTNLHVNAALFPNDTVQSRLPDPAWLDHWLDQQIRFDAALEDKVNAAILKKLSTLLDTPIPSAKRLRQYYVSLVRGRAEHRPAHNNVERAPEIAGEPRTLAIVPPSIQGAAMNATSDHISFTVLDAQFAQIKLDFDADLGALWARMRPAGRPCFSPAFMQEIRQCQQAIEATSGKILKDGRLQDLDCVILSSAVQGIFNLGGDLALFAQLIEQQNRQGLIDYARKCIEISFHNYRNYNLSLQTISLVQGLALGGGFESALSSSLLVAERGAKFGLPEITFNLFPGMGAYTYLARKVGVRTAETLITSGNLYSAEALHELGVVDILAETGEGERAVVEYIKRSKNSRNGLGGVLQARQRYQQVSYDELLDTTMIWVDTALGLSERDLRMIQRLVRAQDRRLGGDGAANNAEETKALPLQAA